MIKPHSTPASFALIVLASTGTAFANECTSIADNTQRLACYDKQFLGAQPIVPADAPVAATNTEEIKATAKAGTANLKSDTSPQKISATSKMIDDWDLAPDSTRKSFELRTYKPVYFLLGTYTDNINTQPHSDNPANNLTTSIPGLSATEAQFQLSFKTRILHNIFGNNGSLWAGYTQSSRWQIYSGQISRPFRETNYEPEAMLMFRTPLALGNWNLRMSGIGINLQSNGRSNPLSRSWNRVIGHFGIENDDLSIQVRPWWRIKEDAVDDNNPGIENYIGRGEVIVAQRLGEHFISLRGRHSLRGGDDSRGSLKLDWAIPVHGNLKAHLSVFSGYGESLIDYNHRQTMVGAGVSLVEW